LFGIAALFIACKYEEVYSVPHVRDLVYVCDNAYSKEDILRTEGEIIEALEFDLVGVSSYMILDFYSQHFKMEMRNLMLARYLIELGILEYTMLKFEKNMIAASAIYLVNKIRHI
jgi:cyclin B